MSSEALIFPISHFLKDLSHSAMIRSKNLLKSNISVIFSPCTGWKLAESVSKSFSVEEVDLN